MNGMRGTYVVSWVGAVKVQRLLESHRGVRDEAGNAAVILGRRVRLRGRRHECQWFPTENYESENGFRYHEGMQEDYVPRFARELDGRAR